MSDYSIREISRCRVEGIEQQCSPEHRKIELKFLTPISPEISQFIAENEHQSVDSFECSTVYARVPSLIGMWASAIGAKGIEAQHNNQLAVADLVLQEVLYEDRPLVRRLIFSPAQTQGLDGDGI